MLQKILDIFGLKGAQKSLLNGKRILVVEDNEVDRKVIVKVLERCGVSVLTAVTGETGIQNARSARPDLIVLDCGLPDINGQEVCERLKLHEETEKIPVIFLTGEDTPKNVIDCYEVGAEYYLTKPVHAKSLINQVKLTLQDQDAGRA